MRDVYLDNIRTRYPAFVPRHDFDIFALGDGRYKGPANKIRSWLDDELATFDNERLAIQSAREMLRAPGIATGVSEQLSCTFRHTDAPAVEAHPRR